MGPAKEGPAGAVALRQRTLFGHPIGLCVLFFTELWERFSFYGMKALLVPYALNALKWSQSYQSGVFKWYTSLVYLTPLLGGYLADRYLGNKRAVIIGAVLMAIGHFLMACDSEFIFYAALIFLIFGNGFFKPNMSVQVGRLYPVNDSRRDAAYTIFYMGINLGAFLAPLICGWLALNTQGGYHSGFAVAGIGMVLGLVIYTVGMPWVVEVPRENVAPTNSQEPPVPPNETPGGRPHNEAGSVLPEGAQDPSLAERPRGPLPEALAERTPSAVPFLNRISPAALRWFGVSLAAFAPLLGLGRILAWDNVIGLEIAAVCAVISSILMGQVHGAVRDRVLAIYILGVFVVFFWAAFEQAGNVMNIWADKITNRNMTTDPKSPDVYPEAAGDAKPGEGPAREGGLAFLTRMFQLKNRPEANTQGGWLSYFSSNLNPVPTAWFLSINPLGIFLFAPFFAILWTWLGRRNLNPSIPIKMAIGIGLQALAFALMIGAARSENQPSSVVLPTDVLPPGLTVANSGQIDVAGETGEVFRAQAGRLTWDAASRTLRLQGVLPDIDRDAILRATAPADFAKALEELKTKTTAAQGDVIAESVILAKPPPGLDLKYAGLSPKAVSYDPATRTLSATIKLADKNIKGLLVAGSDAQLRDALNTLMVESSKFRVSLWWLFWFYILSTLGELCLSPVGLSMVSKLAPAKFATMLMGMWLLVSFFGNFLAGAMGETWGAVPPTEYFLILVVVLGFAALVLYCLVRKIGGMMHGVT
jgi:POT family proton-dependent oligopeptide transporter